MEAIFTEGLSEDPLYATESSASFSTKIGRGIDLVNQCIIHPIIDWNASFLFRETSLERIFREKIGDHEVVGAITLITEVALRIMMGPITILCLAIAIPLEHLKNKIQQCDYQKKSALLS
jgi:hypothetical protein